MKPARPYTRHGLNALKARVKVRGLAGIDRRSAAYRAMDAWRSALVADLGGEAALSALQRAVVDVTARTHMLLDHVDAFLLEQATLLVGRGKTSTLIPVVKERQQLAEALVRYLEQLRPGLGRVAPPVPGLVDKFRGAGSAPEE